MLNEEGSGEKASHVKASWGTFVNTENSPGEANVSHHFFFKEREIGLTASRW